MDKAATVPRSVTAATSTPGRLPLSMFESTQTVGGVAQEMIRFYLHATERLPFQVPDGRQPSMFDAYFGPSVLVGYGVQAGSSSRCDGLRARRHRCNGCTKPMSGRVLAEIDALPPVQRAWDASFMSAPTSGDRHTRAGRSNGDRAAARWPGLAHDIPAPRVTDR